jgi:hypothetical protein
MIDNNKNLSPWQQYKKNLGDTRPWDMLKPNVKMASDETVSLRLDICGSCEEFSITRQCKKCKCFMDMKAQLETAVCPLGKW